MHTSLGLNSLPGSCGKGLKSTMAILLNIDLNEKNIFILIVMKSNEKFKRFFNVPGSPAELLVLGWGKKRSKLTD